MSLVAEKGKEEFISVKAYNAAGTLAPEEIYSVYLFDTPTYLGLMAQAMELVGIDSLTL